jgi:hypothetical protein
MPYYCRVWIFLVLIQECGHREYNVPVTCYTQSWNGVEYVLTLDSLIATKPDLNMLTCRDHLDKLELEIFYSRWNEVPCF